MEENYKKLKFYKVDIDYIKYLNSMDSQVFYKDAANYERKPHLGLVTDIGGFKYCIPLTSAKQRHLKWGNISEHNYVIYEIVACSELKKNDVYKKHGNTDKYKKILAVLEIRKMIPLDEDLCHYINFSEVEDPQYRALLEKEYYFLKPHFENIVDKARKLYVNQKKTGIVKNYYCSFDILEQAYSSYKKESIAV